MQLHLGDLEKNVEDLFQKLGRGGNNKSVGWGQSVEGDKKVTIF